MKKFIFLSGILAVTLFPLLSSAQDSYSSGSIEGGDYVISSGDIGKTLKVPLKMPED